MRPLSSRRVCYMERQRFSTDTERSAALAFLPGERERFKPLQTRKYLQDGALVCEWTAWAPICGGLVEWRRRYLHQLHHVQAGIAGRLSTNLFVSGEGQCAAYTHIQSALESRQVLKRICEICESIQVPMSSLHRPMDQKFLVILVVRHQRLYQNLARDSRGSPALPATKQKSRKNAKHVSRFRLLPCTWTVMHICNCSLYASTCICLLVITPNILIHVYDISHTNFLTIPLLTHNTCESQFQGRETFHS